MVVIGAGAGDCSAIAGSAGGELIFATDRDASAELADVVGILANTRSWRAGGGLAGSDCAGCVICDCGATTVCGGELAGGDGTGVDAGGVSCEFAGGETFGDSGSGRSLAVGADRVISGTNVELSDDGFTSSLIQASSVAIDWSLTGTAGLAGTRSGGRLAAA